MRKDTFTIHKNTQQQLDAIKANDTLTLKKLYQDNYNKCRQYVITNNGSDDEAKDIYQEAFTAMWRNVQLDKYIPQQATSLEGYLYRIVQFKWLDHLRSGDYKKVVALHENIEESVTDNITFFTQEEENNIEAIKNRLYSIGENCRELLTRFYYKKQSLREISQAMNYTEATARNNKYRCIEKLRTSLKKTTDNSFE